MSTEFSSLAGRVVALLAVCLCVHGQETSKTSQQSQQERVPIEVSFCQLVAQSGLYNGKEVVVQATYNGGYEWSVLSSPDCSSDKNLVWLEPSNDKVREEIKLGRSCESVTFDLRVRGVFMSGGKYGHRNRYAYKIIANDVSKVSRTAASALSVILAYLREPSLFEATKDATVRSFRVTYLSTVPVHEVAVRLIVNADGSGQITSAVSSGAETDVRRTANNVSKAEVINFLSWLIRLDSGQR